MGATGVAGIAIHPDIKIEFTDKGRFAAFFIAEKNERTEVRMYALKKITVTEDGRHVEEVHVLGDMYRLEFYPPDAHLAAKIEYCQDRNMPCIPVEKTDEAYITTLSGDTVRCICRGDSKARNEMARCRTHSSK